MRSTEFFEWSVSPEIAIERAVVSKRTAYQSMRNFRARTFTIMRVLDGFEAWAGRSR